MHENNNGDISNWENILDFQQQFLVREGSKHSVDLYTCDLGIDVSDDYNTQERKHFHLNLCQIVCGLHVLKHGGCMIFKHYTIFEDFTISYLSLLTMLFDDVHIVKPLAFKRTNSEIYIVCKGYLYPFTTTVQHSIYNLLINRVITKNYSPLVSDKHIKESIKSIKTAVHHIYNNQILSLNNFLEIIKHNKKTRDIVLKENFAIAREFFKTKLVKISNEKKLRMKNVY